MNPTPQTAIVPRPRYSRIEPISVRFALAPMTPERAAALARRIGLLRAELKERRLVFVKPHVRRWPERAS